MSTELMACREALLTARAEIERLKAERGGLLDALEIQRRSARDNRMEVERMESQVRFREADYERERRVADCLQAQRDTARAEIERLKVELAACAAGPWCYDMAKAPKDKPALLLLRDDGEAHEGGWYPATPADADNEIPALPAGWCWFLNTVPIVPIAWAEIRTKGEPK